MILMSVRVLYFRLENKFPVYNFGPPPRSLGLMKMENLFSQAPTMVSENLPTHLQNHSNFHSKYLLSFFWVQKTFRTQKNVSESDSGA